MLSATWIRLGLVAAILAVGADLAFVAYMSSRGGSTAYYEVPSEAVSGIFIAAFAIAVGGELAFRSHRVRPAVLGAAATFLLIYGVLAILTIGVVLLLAGLVAFAALARVIRAGDLQRNRVSAIGGGLLGLGMTVVILALTRPPTIQCLPGGGVRGSVSSWWGGGAGSSGVASGSSHLNLGGQNVAEGAQPDRGSTLLYRCEAGQLVDVHHEP